MASRGRQAALYRGDTCRTATGVAGNSVLEAVSVASTVVKAPFLRWVLWCCAGALAASHGARSALGVREARDVRRGVCAAGAGVFAGGRVGARVGGRWWRWRSRSRGGLYMYVECEKYLEWNVRLPQYL